MASRLAAAPFRQLTSSTTLRSTTPPLLSQTLARSSRRSFQASSILRQDGVTAARKPVGAFRGTLFGFLLGSFCATAGLYYYVVEEYKVSNELLTEDIYALHAAVGKLEGYVKGMEDERRTSQK